MDHEYTLTRLPALNQMPSKVYLRLLAERFIEVSNRRDIGLVLAMNCTCLLFSWHAVSGVKWHHTDSHTTVLRPSWILPGTTRVSRHQKGKISKVKPVWIYWNKRLWVTSWWVCAIYSNTDIVRKGLCLSVPLARVKIGDVAGLAL